MSRNIHMVVEKYSRLTSEKRRQRHYPSFSWSFFAQFL